MKNVVQFTVGKSKHERTNGEPAILEEFPIPLPERCSPEQLLTALSRDPAPSMENAVVLMTTQEMCPCGCGEEYESMKVYSAGSQVSNERILWMTEKLKLHMMGIDVG